MSVEDPSRYMVPAHLDEPYRFMIFTVEEAVMFFAPSLVGYTFDMFSQGLILGAALYLFLRKVRGGDEDYFLFLKYWIFPESATGFRYTPPSYIRTWYS